MGRQKSFDAVEAYFIRPDINEMIESSIFILIMTFITLKIQKTMKAITSQSQEV